MRQILSKKYAAGAGRGPRQAFAHGACWHTCAGPVTSQHATVPQCRQAGRRVMTQRRQPNHVPRQPRRTTHQQGPEASIREGRVAKLLQHSAQQFISIISSAICEQHQRMALAAAGNGQRRSAASWVRGCSCCFVSAGCISTRPRGTGRHECECLCGQRGECVQRSCTEIGAASEMAQVAHRCCQLRHKRRSVEKDCGAGAEEQAARESEGRTRGGMADGRAIARNQSHRASTQSNSR
jgi:hypothetical protein